MLDGEEVFLVKFGKVLCVLRRHSDVEVVYLNFPIIQAMHFICICEYCALNLMITVTKQIIDNGKLF